MEVKKCQYGEKIAGVVVWFEPDDNDLKNINTYINDIDILYIIDNSSNDNSYKIDRNQKIQYIFNNENIGVSKALNLAAKKAIQEGYTWLLTMDQDTVFELNTMSEMKKAIQKNDISKIGIITPWHNTKLKIQKPKEKIDYPLEVMTSGNLVNLQIYNKIGGYKDWMFIDGIDIEYGLNLSKNGYKIMRLNNVCIKHNLGDIKYKKFLWKKDILCTNHNYLRRYYMTRNYMYIKDMYINSNKEYVSKIAKQKRNILIILLFEKDKYRKIRNIIRGYLDYKKGIKGKYKFEN